MEYCRRTGIHFLTLYAFSTENWQRPAGEISGLMKLLSQFLHSELDEIHENDIRVTTIGDLGRLPGNLVARIEAAKEKTSGNRAMVLNIALSYGGRQDILQAVLRIARALESGDLAEHQVTEEVFSRHLYTSGLPDPDLLIRTGGEIRISNFLLWQCAYAELYFTPVLWPDFDELVFGEAVREYQSRQRRFGRTSDQIQVGERASSC